MNQNQLAEVYSDSAAQFTQAALAALVRAEKSGRVPSRFTDSGREIWHTFRNELSLVDLVAIAIQDAGAMMPLPFDPSEWWPDWPEWALLRQQPGDIQEWLDTAKTYADEPRTDYLRRQAQRLEVSLPSQQKLEQLAIPASHEQWLELPGTGGWVAYTMCTCEDANLYLWENFTVVCTTPQEMMLAGLIAWELDAPPNRPLPIYLDRDDLRQTLQQGRTYDAVIGLGTKHQHRDLTLLQREKIGPQWM